MSSQQNLSPAFFLDRDGTIVKEVGYLTNPEKLQLIPGSIGAIRMINQMGWKTVIISNQSGVGRGYYSEEDVEKVNGFLLQILNRAKVKIDGIYYCPHHPEGKPPYNIVCECRKPAAGMIHKAEAELSIDVSRSAVVGDKYSDVLTALRLEIPGILVLTGYGREEQKKIFSNMGSAIPEEKDLQNQNRKMHPTYIAENLFDAVNWWFKKHESEY